MPSDISIKGLTKQYLRFAPEGIFGVVASKSCNATYLNVEGKPNRFVVTGGTTIINIWDTKFQRKVKTLNCDSPATVIESNFSGDKIAVGHFNGSVSVYDVKDLSEEGPTDPIVTFEGHKNEITTIAWDETGARIASGSKDSNVVVWDVISESGLFKCVGHKGIISRIRFWKDDTYLVTSSYDTTIRIWDVATNQNVHTIACTIQVRDFELFNDLLIVAEANLRLFKLKESEDGSKDDLEWDSEELGTLLRHGHDRPSRVHMVKDTGILLVVGVKSPLLETFRFSSDEEAIKRKKKRLKKDPNGDKEFLLRDLVKRSDTVKASEEKIKSVSSVCEKGIVKIVCCMPSNQLEVIQFPLKEDVTTKKTDVIVPKAEFLAFDGHRKLVRGIAFSSDKTAILTASSDCFKIWNRSTMNCILTIPHEYPVVCCAFCPGDRHFVAGTTDGMLIMSDVSIGAITQIHKGGDENTWGIDIYPNNMGFVTHNGNILQLYGFSMAEGKLRFDLEKQLDVQDNILCVKVSPNMKFVAVGLLDSTVKVFYLDTLKFHLSLYGHSLPIVSIDISSDNAFLVSCAGDKTVKVWGLDFGDCHCSMLHTDGLVGCAFMDKTHLCVSMAKDSINIYDADHRERIQTVKAHVEGGATCMATKGFFIASAGRDQTIRLFKRTQELLVLSDEREEERDKEMEKEIRSDPNLITLETGEGEKWADKVIEALDIYRDPKGTDNSVALMTAYSAKDPIELLFKTLTMIKAAELQQSLKLLPISYVEQFIPALLAILEKYPLSTELVVRCSCFLMQFHETTMRGLDKDVLKPFSALVENRVNDLKLITGINRAGLHCLYDVEKKREEEQMFREMLGERKRKRKKREKAIKRALLTV